MRALFALVFCVQAYLVLGQCSDLNLCSTDQTCCVEPSSEEVGCCPEPDAVCCSDGLHCCPSGTVCDLSKGVCDSPSNIPFVFPKKEQPGTKLKSVSTKRAQNVERVYCPGGQYYCQDGQTCCQEPSGIFTCCPYPSASCCPDGLHCCQHGYRCDATSRYCSRADSAMAVAANRSATTALPHL